MHAGLEAVALSGYPVLQLLLLFHDEARASPVNIVNCHVVFALNVAVPAYRASFCTLDIPYGELVIDPDGDFQL